MSTEDPPTDEESFAELARKPQRPLVNDDETAPITDVEPQPTSTVDDNGRAGVRQFREDEQEA